MSSSLGERHAARQRPRIHFTAERGWTNDPHGIVYVDGTYHLFFQYNPDDTVWSERMCWGHAISSDLLHWREVDVALIPTAGEVGCWSGATVLVDDGPAILYTSVRAGDVDRGRIALARGTSDLLRWDQDAARIVINPPPMVPAFRDPYVWRVGTGWRALVGAGIVEQDRRYGTALQYSSQDLRTWRLDGPIARRAATQSQPVRTGRVWECPQLVEVDGHWVLLISGWDGDPLGVSYAVGDYDGLVFSPRAWRRFGYGFPPYATTVFRDADERPCALSWLRENQSGPPAGSPWAGAMSLPHVLRSDGTRVWAEQHPHLDGLLGPWHPMPRTGVPVAPGQVWQIRLEVARLAAGEVTLSAETTGGAVRIRLAGVPGPAGAVQVEVGAARIVEQPIRATGPPVVVELVGDADLVEITSSGTEGVAVARLPAPVLGTLRVSTDGATHLRRSDHRATAH